MWLSKRQILVWLKHNTSNLTGGTINIAANVVNCNWPVISMEFNSRQKSTLAHNMDL